MGSTPPHVYAIAERAFRHMRGGRWSQSIICSGDSGAGKTETCKYVLRYLTTMAGKCLPGKGIGEMRKLEQLIIEANPIMEAFGNAKTGRNNNSSRFGKFIRVHFGEEEEEEEEEEIDPETGIKVKKEKLDIAPNLIVVGADITTYLLEKSRLITQPQQERNFHVFYQLLSGVDGDLRKDLHLDGKSADDFRITNTSGCSSIKGVDDAASFQHIDKGL